MASSLWLDKLRAVPIVGFRFAPVYRSSSTLIDNVESFIGKWHEKNWKPEVTIDGPNSFSLESRSGYGFTVSHDNLVGRFSYKAKVVTHPNQDPSVQLSQPATSYSDLLDSLEETTLEFFDLLNKSRPRQLVRIGIVAQTSFSPEKLPPGVRLLVKHLGDPWVKGLEGYNAHLTAQLASGNGTVDKCHHFVKTSDPEEDVPQVSLNLDWQRVFSEPVPISPQKLSQLFVAAKKDALKYFDTFGLGDLSYAE